VAEAGTGADAEVIEHGRERQGTEAHDDDRSTSCAEQCQLGGQVRGARPALVRRRRVGGRGALDRRRHVGVDQAQPVVGRRRRRLRRQAHLVHHTEQPVTAAVACEHAPGAVGAVGGGGEPDDDDPGLAVTEARYTPPPIRLGGERRPLLGGHLLTPRDKARAASARRHLSGYGGERIHPLDVRLG